MQSLHTAARLLDHDLAALSRSHPVQPHPNMSPGLQSARGARPSVRRFVQLKTNSSTLAPHTACRSAAQLSFPVGRLPMRAGTCRVCGAAWPQSSPAHLSFLLPCAACGTHAGLCTVPRSCSVLPAARCCLRGAARRTVAPSSIVLPAARCCLRGAA